MRKSLTKTLILTGVTVLGLAPVGAAAYDRGTTADSGSYGGGGSFDGDSSWGGSRDDLKVIGLSNGRTLSRFTTNDPGRTSTIGNVTLTGDKRLVGIDFRVQNAALYGVGDLGGLYRINSDTAAATKVGQLTVALEGVNFGVDFNPAANALRITGDGGQNLRQPFATVDDGVAGQAPTAVDGRLNTPGAQATPVPGADLRGVTAVAYSNNDLDANSNTVLYDINTIANNVSIQSPANSGFLVPTGNLANGDFADDTGFDIYSRVRPMTTGKAVELFSYAVSGGKLFRITLTNGQADLVGSLGNPAITDLAIPLNQL